MLIWILLSGVFVGGEALLTNSASLAMEHAIPRKNWHSPALFPISVLPHDMQYGERECSIVESFVTAMLKDFKLSGVLNEEELDSSLTALWHCKPTICSSSALLSKLTEVEVAAELATVMMTRGKQFTPEYGVFRHLVDPFFWDILEDVSYPIIDAENFYDQRDAAFKIVTRVCGHQNMTLKVRISPDILNRIFTDILLDDYTRNAFTGNLKDLLIHETDTYLLQTYWSEAAMQRETEGVCLDNALTSSSERDSVNRIRETAGNLDVDCASFVLDFQFSNVGVAPSGPSGPSGGAPGSPGSTGGAPGAPSSRGGGSRFAPGS